jgi:hypothetical protein
MQPTTTHDEAGMRIMIARNKLPTASQLAAQSQEDGSSGDDTRRDADPLALEPLGPMTPIASRVRLRAVTDPLALDPLSPLAR